MLLFLEQLEHHLGLLVGLVLCHEGLVDDEVDQLCLVLVVQQLQRRQGEQVVHIVVRQVGDAEPLGLVLGELILSKNVVVVDGVKLA